MYERIKPCDIKNRRGLSYFTFSVASFSAEFFCINEPYTVEPLNNGHVGDEHFVHCSEVVPSSEVEMYGQYIGRGQTVCPL